MNRYLCRKSKVAETWFLCHPSKVTLLVRLVPTANAEVHIDSDGVVLKNVPCMYARNYCSCIFSCAFRSPFTFCSSLWYPAKDTSVFCLNNIIYPFSASMYVVTFCFLVIHIIYSAWLHHRVRLHVDHSQGGSCGLFIP